jgi:hypothetical protein
VGGANPPTHFEPIDAWEHHVEEHQIERPVALERRQRDVTALHVRELDAMRGEILGEQASELAIVVDQ